MNYISDLSMINIKKNIIVANGVRKNIWLSSLFVFLFFMLIYGSVYFFSGGVAVVDDHFFSIKFASLLRDNPEFFLDIPAYLPNWGGRAYVQLFNIFLIPFTFFNNLLVALQVSDVFLASASFALIYWALRKLEIRYPFLLLLILFSSNQFTERMFMGRGYVLTFGLVLLEVYLVQKKKYKHFFWLALFHVLWHKASIFFPGIVVFAVEISRYLVREKVEWKNFAVATLAPVFGMAFFFKLSLEYIVLG